MIHLLEAFLEFLAVVSHFILRWFMVLGFLMAAYWVSGRFLTGKTTLPLGGCLGFIVKLFGFALIGAALGAYLGELVANATIQSVWLRGFFTFAGLVGGIVVWFNLVIKK